MERRPGILRKSRSAACAIEEVTADESGHGYVATNTADFGIVLQAMGYPPLRYS